MRTWQAYYKGACRLAAKYTDEDDEDARQEAALAMLQCMLFLHANFPKEERTNEWCDPIVKENIERALLRYVNVDTTIDIHEQDGMSDEERRDREGNLLALRNAVSRDDPPDVVYERSVRDSFIRATVKRLPSPGKEIVMFHFWEPERLEGWLEKHHPELITPKPGHRDWVGVLELSLDVINEALREEGWLCPNS